MTGRHLLLSTIACVAFTSAVAAAPADRQKLETAFDASVSSEDQLGWLKSSGSGTLHSFCVLRQGAPEGHEADLPYALGVVKLDEGVQILARLGPNGADDWSAYACEDRVTFLGKEDGRECARFGRSVD